MWETSYGDAVAQLATSVEQSIPARWQLDKDDLLNPEKAEVVKSLLVKKRQPPASTMRLMPVLARQRPGLMAVRCAGKTRKLAATTPVCVARVKNISSAAAN